MKAFLKKTFFLSVLFVCITGALVTSMQYIIESRTTFSVDANSQSLIFGNSHPECAFNDSIISGFQNFSESGESYFYTYIKCKKILEDNPQVKNVFIEFGVYNLSKEMDDWTWDDEHMNFRYPNFSPFMTFDEHRVLLANNPAGYLSSLSISIKHQIPRLINARFDYSDVLGGFVPHNPKPEKSSDSDLLNNVELASTENDISLFNLEMLNKIISLCNDGGKNVYLVRSPIMSRDKQSQSEKVFEKIRTNHFSEIEYLDFSDFALNTGDFKDPTHLNRLGAYKFSAWFNQNFKSFISK